MLFHTEELNLSSEKVDVCFELATAGICEGNQGVSQVFADTIVRFVEGFR
jgi:hypothetical protein